MLDDKHLRLCPSPAEAVGKNSLLNQNLTGRRPSTAVIRETIFCVYQVYIRLSAPHFAGSKVNIISRVSAISRTSHRNFAASPGSNFLGMSPQNLTSYVEIDPCTQRKEELFSYSRHFHLNCDCLFERNSRGEPISSIITII